MKNMMRSGNRIGRGISLLLMLSLLITLLPTATAAAATVGTYGSVTVTAKNVVIRATAAGSRTGFFAQKGTYPMIGPVETVDGVDWYNIQTSETSGFVSGLYATGSYGSAGMPTFDKKYVNIIADIVAYDGAATTGYNHTLGGGHQVPITAAANPVLQLETGDSYTVDSVAYINLYFNDALHHTEYTNAIANYIMSVDNVNDYIYSTVWPNHAGAATRQKNAKGDILTHAIQTALNVLGYFDETIDASFGDLTENAVKSFQTKNSLSPVDGIVGATTYAKLFPAAIAEVDYRRANYGLGSTPGTTTVNMIQTTIKNLRLRKSYSTSSAYVGVIPTAGTILTYTRTQLNGSTTWYYVQYDGVYGWVMGNYVTAYTTPTGGGTPITPTISNWGTVTITKKLTAIRVTANGKRTGYSVNTGDVCTMIGPSVDAGGYTWYHIRTENGREGYVRGDCATASFGSAGMPSTPRKYVQFLYDGMQVRKGVDPALSAANPWVTLPKGSVLQLTTGIDYTSTGTAYINLYYLNEEYHALYTNALVEGMMSQDNTNNYISGTVWAQALDASTVAGQNGTATVNTYKGDIRVHAIQAALYQLGLYDDTMDGSFGPKTATGVIKFKQNNSITPADELVSSTVSITLFTQAKAALQAKLTAASGTDTGDGTVPAAGNFGTVNTVKKGSWSEIDGGATSLFRKGSTVTVMSVATKQVFRLYRWSGTNHADCVPYDTSDTATLSSILGVTYNAASPSSSELALVKGDGNEDWPDYTWPKFRWGGTTLITDSDGKIPVWININGTVYCASIYVIPHGFTGTSGFSLSKLEGKLYYERNNMYGMLCVHFYGSTTHVSGTVNADHMANINYAYNNAAAYFGASKVK